MSEHTRDSKEAILKYLDHTKMVYELTEDVFLKNSLHKLRNYFTWHMLKGIINFSKIGTAETMNQANSRAFKDPDWYKCSTGMPPTMVPALTWRRLP